MDFSGASLKLNAEGEDKVLGVLDKIDKKAQETFENAERLSQQELNDRVARYDAMYAKQESSARQAAQRIAQYEREVAAEHIARMRQQSVADREAEQAQNALARTQGEVEAATNRSARGALAASRALEVMGRTGKEAGRSLDTLLTQVGYLAFGFGAEGALVGAIAIGTAAIVELFNRTGREMDKLQETYQHTIESIAKSGSVLRADQAKQEAYSGDPFAEITGRNKGESDIQFLARSQGLLGLRAERSRLFQKEANQVANADFDPEVQKSNLKKVRDAIAEVDREVGLLGVQWSKANALEDSFLKKAVEEQNQAAARAREKRDLRADERSVAEYQNEELNRIVQRIKSSGDLTNALINEHDGAVALQNEQALLSRELEQGNISVQRRIQLEGELARITKELATATSSYITIFSDGVARRRESGSELENGYSEYDQVVPGFSTRNRLNIKPADLSAANAYDKQQIAAIKESGKKMEAEAERMSNEIGRALARGITAGITSAFSGKGIGGAFAAMTSAILDGLGNMFAQVAEKALIGSTIMKSLVKAISEMNPWVAAVAAGALLAFGNSIRSSGSSGGSGYGGGGGGGGTGSLPTIGTAGVITAAPNSVVTNPATIQSRAIQQNTFFVIGENDPRAGRQIQRLLDNNARRG